MSKNIIPISAALMRKQVKDVLTDAKKAKLSDIVVIGLDQDGVLYMDASSATDKDIIYLLEVAKTILLKDFFLPDEE